MSRAPLRGARSDELSPEQEQELLWPFSILMLREEAGSSSFVSEAARRRAWLQHRDRLIEQWRREHPGRRPPLYWRYETEFGDLGPTLKALKYSNKGQFREEWPWPARVETAWLAENGKLGEAERRAVKRRLQEYGRSE